MTGPATRVVASPIGPLALVAADGALVGVYLDGHHHRVPAGAHPDDGDPVLGEAATQLDAYFAGRLERFDLPLRPVGTEFQRTVWAALCAIPYGTTTTYGVLAERIGRPRAVRAVGLANGRNPLAVVVPCHRVIGADGRLTGYAGGLDRKRALLDLETGQGRPAA